MAQENSPLVGIVMGSTSDFALMQPCFDQLDVWGIPYETKVASAHRVPNMGQAWASGAHERGMKVIIVAASSAVQLGSIIAAFTPLPVIFVPTKRISPQRVDAMLSMDRNGSGAPVAAVAADGAKDAAILAVQIMGVGDPALAQLIVELKKQARVR